MVTFALFAFVLPFSVHTFPTPCSHLSDGATLCPFIAEYLTVYFLRRRAFSEYPQYVCQCEDIGRGVLSDLRSALGVPQMPGSPLDAPWARHGVLVCSDGQPRGRVCLVASARCGHCSPLFGNNLWGGYCEAVEILVSPRTWTLTFRIRCCF